MDDKAAHVPLDVREHMAVVEGFFKIERVEAPAARLFERGSLVQMPLCGGQFPKAAQKAARRPLLDGRAAFGAQQEHASQLHAPRFFLCAQGKALLRLRRMGGAVCRNGAEGAAGLSGNAEILPPKPYRFDRPVAYYGHSITQGGCASRAGNSYPNIVGRRLNVDFINLGFSGNCKGEEEMAKYIAGLEMQALVMDYDHNAPNLEHLQATHELFFKIIRERNPDLPVIFMTSTAQARFFDDQEGRKEVIRTTYENALTAGDKNVYFIDGSKIYDGCDAATVEGCHANDLGFWLQAGVVGKILENMLKG